MKQMSPIVHRASAPDDTAGGGADTPIAEAAASFDLNKELLASHGFFAPQGPSSRLALELRAIKRRLLRRLDYKKRGQRRRPASGASRKRPRNLIMVTSTRPAEGKTFTSINLALSLAIEDNIGTVLVDADAPRPKVMKHFGLDAGGMGFTDLLARPSDVHVREALRREHTHKLALIGEGTERARSTELYSRDEAGVFLKDLSARFPDRLIILDAPPVLATPEAALLAPHVDEIIFVVEANETPEPAVATAIDELLDANDRISLVLNRALVAENVIHYGSYDEYYDKADRD